MIYFLIYLISIPFYSFSKVINETFLYQKIENLSGNEFIYNKKIVNGKKDLSWSINNESVNKQEYRDNYLKLKQQELLDEFENEDQNESQEEELKLELQISTVKKLLSLKINEIQQALNKIKELKEYNLSEYFVFEQNSFKDEYELENIEKSLIPEIQKYLEKNIDKITLFDLNNYLEKIEHYPEKIEQFLKKSINHSIKSCDDTKILRKLLELIN